MNEEMEAVISSKGGVRNSRYAWYAVILLTLAYTMSFIDRQLLNLLVEPIKHDILLTDTQISLLQGLAFMGAYVVFGPIFGRWVDLGHRRNIIVMGIAIWSACTVLCGLSTNFWGLACARAGVGAAEACLTPAAWSMICDYFNRDRLPRAMSVFLIAPYLGGGLALIFGGIVIASVKNLNELVPALSGLSLWQLPFIFVGAPGVVLALLLFTVREPLRFNSTDSPTGDSRFSLQEVAKFLWIGRAFFCRLYPGMALIMMVFYALPAWMPAYLMRHFGALPAQVGLQYGTVVLIMGSAGVIVSPWLDRWLRIRDYRDTPVRVAVIAGVGLTLLSCALALAPTYRIALATSGCATFFYSLPQTMAALALQLATPNRMRGVFAALYVFINSVMGLGLAPTIVAILTDYVFRDPHKVGWSLAICCSVSAALATYLIWRALPHYRDAMDRARNM
jgi:MFS family permease